MLSAMLMISAGSFASNSINDSKGSEGEDSSAVVENVNKIRSHKNKNKVKGYYAVPICFSSSAAFSAAFVASLSS
jgi:hypothetical protein